MEYGERANPAKGSMPCEMAQMIPGCAGVPANLVTTLPD